MFKTKFNKRALAFLLTLSFFISYVPTEILASTQQPSVTASAEEPVWKPELNAYTGITRWGNYRKEFTTKKFIPSIQLFDDNKARLTNGDSAKRTSIIPDGWVKAGVGASELQPLLYKKDGNFVFYYNLAQGATSLCVTPDNRNHPFIDLTNEKQGELLIAVGFNYALGKMNAELDDTLQRKLRYPTRVLAWTGNDLNPVARQVDPTLYREKSMSDKLSPAANAYIQNYLYDIYNNYTSNTGQLFEYPIVFHTPDNMVKPLEVREVNDKYEYVYDITELTRNDTFPNGSLQKSVTNGNGVKLNSFIKQLTPAQSDWNTGGGNVSYSLLPTSDKLYDATKSRFKLVVPKGTTAKQNSYYPDAVRVYQKFTNASLGLPDSHTTNNDAFFNKFNVVYSQSTAASDTQVAAQMTPIAAPIFLNVPPVGDDRIVYTFVDVDKDGNVVKQETTEVSLYDLTKYKHEDTIKFNNKDYDYLESYVFDGDLKQDSSITKSTTKEQIADLYNGENYKPFYEVQALKSITSQTFGSNSVEYRDLEYIEKSNEGTLNNFASMNDINWQISSHSFRKPSYFNNTIFKTLRDDTETLSLIYISDSVPVDREETPSESHESDLLQWNSIPFTYGELKEGTYSDSRSTEKWEAMNGLPETETMYYNGGVSEGVMDNTYTFEQHTEVYTVTTTASGGCSGHPAPNGGTTRCTSSWSDVLVSTYSHEFKFLHFDNVTMSLANSITLTNPILKSDTITITPSAEIQGSISLSPKGSGLDKNYGVGVEDYNYGATLSTQKTFNYPHGYQDHTSNNIASLHAADKATTNATIGMIFAQNDSLQVTINGKTYDFTPIGVNKQMTQAIGNNDPLIAGIKNDYAPTSYQMWSPISEVPVTGYTGQPEISNRNAGNITFIKDGIQLDERLTNGLYEFESVALDNFSKYTQSHLAGPNSSKTSPNPLKSAYATTSVTESPTHLKSATEVRSEYLAWQNSDLEKYEKPDGVKDTEQTYAETQHDRYYGVNPIIVHNPVTSNYIWVNDTPDNILFDQRINENELKFTNRYAGATDTKYPQRLYIDQDFSISIPNIGSLSTYWGNNIPSTIEQGVIDIDSISPGTRGLGYTGSALNNIKDRDVTNKYNLGTSGLLDTSKWINAKYVKFPFDTYYYKNGTPEFHGANTWITLYSDDRTVKLGDPTSFTFKVASNVGDAKDQGIKIIVESINSDTTVKGNPDALWSDGESYANGKRTKAYGGTQGLSAPSSAKFEGVANSGVTGNQGVMDVIGRIGNLAVTSSSDPSFSSVFWNKDANGNLKTSEVKSGGFYGSMVNMYQTNQASNNFYNRFSVLDYLQATKPNYNLPIGKSPVTEYSNQYTKMGYEILGSVQTVGTHNGSITMYPYYTLAGSGWSSTSNWKLMATDPLGTNKTLQEFYSSNTSATDKSTPYTPKLKYSLEHSLLNPRAKISATEKLSSAYVSAQAKGSTHSVNAGTPSKVTIPDSLMTKAGAYNLNSTGFQGVNANKTNVRNEVASNNASSAFTNAQRWHFSLSLPQNTKVVIGDKVEPHNKDQLINTRLVTVTRGGTSLWDLVISEESLTSTNTDSSTNTPSEPPITITPKVDLPLITWNYSNPASDDKMTIGTQ